MQIQNNTDISVRTIIARTLAYIIKDAIHYAGLFFIICVIFCTCIQNGWLFPKEQNTVTYDSFWSLYSTLLLMMLPIMFLKGINGGYNIKITFTKINTGTLKAAQKTDNLHKEKENDQNVL